MLISYLRCLLSFVHSISSNVRRGHSVAAPYCAHWHQSTKSLPDLISIACGYTYINADKTLTFLVSSKCTINANRNTFIETLTEVWCHSEQGGSALNIQKLTF